jgi:hypothetical protein
MSFNTTKSPVYKRARRKLEVKDGTVNSSDVMVLLDLADDLVYRGARTPGHELETIKVDGMWSWPVNQIRKVIGLPPI